MAEQTDDSSTDEGTTMAGQTITALRGRGERWQNRQTIRH